MNLERIALLLWRRLESRDGKKRIYFFLYRRAQSLIYYNVEIAVNDICRECFILCLIRVVQEERDCEMVKKNDGTWRSHRLDKRGKKETHIEGCRAHRTFVILEREAADMSYTTCVSGRVGKLRDARENAKLTGVVTRNNSRSFRNFSKQEPLEKCLNYISVIWKKAIKNVVRMLHNLQTPHQPYPFAFLLLPNFDRLPFPALVFCAKNIFFFCLFHVKGELWLMYKFPSFFLLVLQGKAQKSFAFSVRFFAPLKR